MLDNDTTSSRVAASSSVQSNELVDITNGDAERKSNAANTEGGRGGIPDRGNEKPALSKPGQKEKGEGGRELVPFHSASDIYRTRPTRFLLLLPSLPPSSADDRSFRGRGCHRFLVKDFAKVKGAPFSQAPSKRALSLHFSLRVASVVIAQ